MKGWSESEARNKELMAPCGLHCGTCGIYIATRDKNEKFQKIMANLYGTKPEETVCFGCMQQDSTETLYGWCRNCEMRDCVKAKGFYSCHQCQDWPCNLVETFPLATGRRVMKRTIPVWRQLVHEHGDEEGSVAWSRWEFERYHCSACDEPLFRGAQRCRACKKAVVDELDGTL